MRRCFCCGKEHGDTKVELDRCYRTMPLELRKHCWSGREILRLSDEYDKEQKLKKWRPSD